MMEHRCPRGGSSCAASEAHGRCGRSCRRDPAPIIGAGLFLCAILFPVSCAGLGNGAPTIKGMVYSMDGTPLAGARVSLDGGSAALSDMEGRFGLRRPPGGRPGKPALLEASRNGCEAIHERIILPEKDGILYVSLRTAADLRALALRAMAEGDWREALSRANRAVAVRPGAPSRYLAALLLSAPDNPLRDQTRALEILRAMRSEGMVNEWVERLIDEIEGRGKGGGIGAGSQPPQ